MASAANLSWQVRRDSSHNRKSLHLAVCQQPEVDHFPSVHQLRSAAETGDGDAVVERLEVRRWAAAHTAAVRRPWSSDAGVQPSDDDTGYDEPEYRSWRTPRRRICRSAVRDIDSCADAVACSDVVAHFR